MKRIVLFVLMALPACGNKAENAETRRREETPAEVLEDAGDDVGQLCLVVDRYPGTPEAATAMERLEARHARAVAELPARAAERNVQPKVAAALQAILRAAAGKECNHSVGVSVEVTFADSVTRYADNTAGGDFGGVVSRSWPYDERTKLGEEIGLALEEMTGGYLNAVDVSGPTDLSFALEVVADGRVEIGTVATIPGLAIDPVLTIRTPGAPDEQLTLDRLAFDAQGTVEYRKGNDDARSAEFEAVKQLTSTLASRVGSLVGKLGLAPVGEPALERFAGFALTKVTVVEDPCDFGAPDVGEPVTVRRDERELKIDFYTGRAVVEGDTLVSTDTVRDPLCFTRDTERWELAIKGGHLEGTYVATRHEHEDCKKECVTRVEVVAEKEP